MDKRWWRKTIEMHVCKLSIIIGLEKPKFVKIKYKAILVYG